MFSLPSLACLLFVGLAVSAVGHGAEPPLPIFTDVTEQAGLDFKHGFGDDNLSNIVEGTGSGAVFFDYDGDGWLDIYLLNGAWHPEVSDTRGRKYRGQLKNRLFRNNRDGTFTDVTDEAGWATWDSVSARRRRISTATGTWICTC
jgi:enediyne biosynthesis protein E4